MYFGEILNTLFVHDQGAIGENNNDQIANLYNNIWIILNLCHKKGHRKVSKTTFLAVYALEQAIIDHKMFGLQFT